jgi:hypothetical protein
VRDLFETALAEAHQVLLAVLGSRMTILLNKAADELLGRERYERRGHVPDDVEGGECLHCHTRQSDHFTRYGGRKRSVTIYWGDLQVRWPRAICECGHCIKLNLKGWL